MAHTSYFCYCMIKLAIVLCYEEFVVRLDPVRPSRVVEYLTGVLVMSTFQSRHQPTATVSHACIRAHAHMYIYIYVFMRACMCVCAYTCMHTRTHVRTHTRTVWAITEETGEEISAIPIFSKILLYDYKSYTFYCVPCKIKQCYVPVCSYLP